MEHIMKLNPSPFKKIQEGKKTIELRLYDEKRRLISAGDTICFVNTQDAGCTLYVTVEDIYRFGTFEELYANLPLSECGYTEENVAEASPSDMEAYYPKEKQAKYGVVGIKMSLGGNIE